MRLFTLLLWAGVSVGCWQVAGAQQTENEGSWTAALSSPLDMVGSAARQWWDNLQSQAKGWSALVEQYVAGIPIQPQRLPGAAPVTKQATGPQRPPLLLSQQPASGELCPTLPDEQQLLPQGASSLQELEGWFQAVDQTWQQSLQEEKQASSSAEPAPVLVAPPVSMLAAETQEDRLVLEETSGCGCFDSPPEMTPVADLVRDLRHSAGQQLAAQLNEENDGLNDAPIPVLARQEVETEAAGLAVTAPWLDECDDFCHMDALGPSQVEITSRPAYSHAAAGAIREATEELARRSFLALDRIARGFREAWQILRGEAPGEETPAEQPPAADIPHNARRVQEGDIGL